MKQLCLCIAIVFSICVIQNSCTQKQHIRQKSFYEIGAGIFHFDTSQRVRIDSVALVCIDSLLPDPKDSTKNIWQMDSIFQYMRTDTIKVNGKDSIRKQPFRIPNHWIRAYVGPQYYPH